MLQVILVGYGFAGEIHARVYKSKPDCNLLAIVEKDQSKFDAIRKDHPETKIFSEIKNALSVLPQEVMVDLCVPPPEYFSICELCREKNITNFAIEKPLGWSQEQVNKLDLLLRDQSVFYLDSYQFSNGVDV